MKPGNRRKHGANSSREICEDEEEKYSILLPYGWSFLFLI